MQRKKSEICAVLLSPLVALAFVTSAAAATNAPTDAWITTKVKISLATSDQVSSMDVNVDTINGEVTLHGTVDTAAAKEAAEREARGVQGVSKVRNLLQVVPEKKQQMVEAKDDEIRSRVSKALENQPALSGSDISVQSVNKGVVLLGGTADTMSDHLTALRTARGVQGVRRVKSEVQASDELASNDLWRDEPDAKKAARAEAKAEAAGEEAGNDVEDAADSAANGIESAADKTGNAIQDTAGAVGSAARDLYVTSMVKTKLLAEDDTPAMNINVDTQDGVVSLFGQVPSAASKAEAERIARDTAGVRSVRNQLDVGAAATAGKPEAEAAGAQPSAAAVEDELKKSMDEHSELDNVNVDVKGCVAHLSGSVDSGVERVEALQLARATDGICSVRDELTIR